MTALVFGSTGLVGQHLIDALLSDPTYEKVVSFVRHKTDKKHKKLVETIIDFEDLENLELEHSADHVYLCLGTTMSKAGSKANFFKVDYTYTLKAAQWAQKKGAQKACLVSAIGASQNSWFYYSKVKGQVERDLLALDFKTTVVVRPSLLLGKRQEYRKGEVMAERASQWLGFLYSGPFAKYKPVKAADVALSMLQAMKDKNQKSVYIESHQI